MDQVAGLVWTMVAVVALLFAALTVSVVKLFGVNRELRKLNRTLQGLEARIGEQERQLAQVRAALDDRGGGDLFAPLVEAFKVFKSKGWAPALTLLGSHLFRSYLGRRRQKPLPSKGSSEE